MRVHKRGTGFGLLLALAMAPAAGAQQPRVTNAKFEARAATPNLASAFHALVRQQKQPAWIGYAAPVASKDRRMCCWNSSERGNCCGACSLEGHDGFNVSKDEVASTKLEGPTHFLVLFRAENGRVGKILAFSEDCELDAGGLPFYWLGEARAEESIALLTTFVHAVDEDEENRVGRHAVAAIALHAGPAADRALESFVAPDQPVELRRHTAFWLGAERGRRGYEVLKKLVHDDPSEDVRDKAVFALSVSKEPEAVDAMIEVAHNDRSSHVRGQALFWLGQKAGKKAVGAITEAIEKDPDTQIKKRAVFALSQLPKDEGVPLLIQLARTNKNAAVRKQAMFWLGQSNDPRALAFFEEVLRQ